MKRQQHFENDSSKSEENGTPTKRRKSAKKQIIKCSHCGRGFKTDGRALRHACIKKTENSYPDFVINGYKFTCKVCNQTFRYLSGLTKHEQKHQAPGGFICNICGARFLTEIARSTHKETTHKIFKCLICEDKFESHDDYISHINKVHDGKDRELFVCANCGAQFKTHAQIKQHNDSKCGTVKCYSCNQCGSKFMTPNTLNAHILIHVGEKKHLCGFCGNSFLSKGQLKVHERSHTGEKPFKCEVCSKAFSYRESLVTHSSIHTGIKPYICEGCGNRFSCIGNLIKHRKSRPNSCGLPQFDKNTKIAPRASAKNPGSLTMKAPQRLPRTPYERRTKNIIRSFVPEMPPILNVSSISTVDNIPSTVNASSAVKLSQKININTPKSVNVPPPIVSNAIYQAPSTFKTVTPVQLITTNFKEPLNDSNVKMETIMNELQNIQEHHGNEVAFLSHAESMEIVSNVEIEYITSDIHPNVKENNESEVVYQEDNFEMNFIENLNATENETYVESWQDDQSVYENDNMSHPACYNEYNSKIQEDSTVKTEHELILGDESELALGHIANELKTNGEIKVSSQKLEISNIINVADQNEAMDQIIAVPAVNVEVITDVFIPTNITDDVPIPNVGDIEKQDNESESEYDKNHSTFITYRCDHCPKQYLHKKPFAKHLESEHGINKLIEDSKAHKRKSSRRGSNKQEMTCKVCKRSYLSLAVLIKHEADHGEDGSLIHKCSCCRTYFATTKEVEKHQILQHKDKLNCKECDKMFKEPDNLNAHFRYAHGKEPLSHKKYMYVCPRCGRKFSAKIALSDHERSDCGEAPIYRCNVCDKCYHSAGSLKTHQTIHTGELPHLCKFCGKAFRTHGQVKVHERKHNGEKPFKCEFCSKRFAYRESLLTHLSLHTGMKRFMCQACGNRFSCISNLLAHRKSHKNTCGLVPNMTKAVGPMGFDKITLIEATKG